MRNGFILLMLWLTAAAVSAAGEDHTQSAQRLMKEGLKHYRQGDYSEAEKFFAEAAEAANGKREDPAVAVYNAGNARFMNKQMEEAAEAYANALRSTDETLQKKTFYNLGTTRLRQAGSMLEEGDLNGAQQINSNALLHLQQAIQLDPVDRDAKINYELAMQQENAIREALQQQQQQQQQKEQQKDQQQKEQKEQQDSPDSRQQPEPEKSEGDESESEPPPPPDENEQPGQPEEPSAPRQAEEMTPEEAEMMLEAFRQEENAERKKIKLKLGREVPVNKDW